MIVASSLTAPKLNARPGGGLTSDLSTPNPTELSFAPYKRAPAHNGAAWRRDLRRFVRIVS